MSFVRCNRARRGSPAASTSQRPWHPCGRYTLTISPLSPLSFDCVVVGPGQRACLAPLPLTPSHSLPFPPLIITIIIHHQLDSVLSSVLGSVPVDLMPGASDPSNCVLPQQPLHPCLLPHRCTNKQTNKQTTNKRTNNE